MSSPHDHNMEDFGEKKHVIEIDTVETVLPENTCCQAQLLPMVSSIRPQLERLEKRIGDINSLLEQRLPCPGMEGIEFLGSQYPRNDRVPRGSIQSNNGIDLIHQFEERGRMLDKQGLEIKELSAQLNKEKSKTKALHQIIISSGQPASYLPRDEDIREVFQQLSVLIQNTIHKYATVDVSKGSERWWHKGNDDHRFAYREKIFTKSYNEFDGETKRLWLRAWVALILNRELLGIPRFGAEMQLDEGLSRIERDFKDSAKVRKEDFLEWRSQTIAVLRASNPKSPLPRNLVENLLNTLGPVLRIDDSSVQKAVNKLCEKALEAILLLRMSKTTMTWDFPRDNGMFNPDEMEPLNGDVRSGDSTNATVLYTVFGSVIKLPNPLYLIDDEPPRVVLRKAEVLLHDPPR